MMGGVILHRAGTHFLRAPRVLGNDLRRQMNAKIPYTKPSITDLEVQFATDAAAHGWGEQCYAYIERFERGFAEHLDVRFAIATSSCTGALQLGLAALGIGRGDEVILADTNWIATAAPIVHAGARPVFVDVREDTWCIDPARVEAAITPRTRAIIAVHLYGNLCDVEALLEIGRRHGIPVIEDAAEAIGAEYRGRRAGSLGHFGTFSFHGTKTLTTGEGGMLVTNDETLHDRVLSLSNHGRARGQTKQFWPDMVGYKFKMSNVQAAIGCAQMERIDELIARKRGILQRYRELLSGYDCLTLNPEPTDGINGAWMPTVVVAKETGVTREQLQQRLAAEHADARVFFHPLSSLDMFESVPENRCAYDLPTRAINLPSYHDMTDEEQRRVAMAVRACLPGVAAGPSRSVA
jgi:perosamine synthetase